MKSRWIQFGSAVTAMIMIANLQYAWTLFVEPLKASHKTWDGAGIQWGVSLFLLFETWVTPLEGWLIDRLGPRLFLSMGGVLVGIGWTALAYVQTLTQLYIFYAIAGVGAAFVYSGSIATALKWFPDKRGTISGFITAGFGAGAALFLKLISDIINASGYSTAFLYTGIAQGIVILIVAQVLHNPGPDFHLTPAAKKVPSPRIRRTSGQFNSLEMLATPHFYLLFVTFVMISVGGTMITVQNATVAKSFNITTKALLSALVLGRLFIGGGRIFWGWISDRIGREMAMFIPYALQALGLVAVLVLGHRSGWWFNLTMMAVFFIWGSMFSLFPAIIGDYFGADNATSNYGFLYMAKGVAGLLAGGVAAWLFQKFGNWNWVFYGSAALAVVAAVLVLVVRAMPLPVKQEIQSESEMGRLAEAG
jgi:OFA family oxalate/formate antiporter-like MFS transporter